MKCECCGKEISSFSISYLSTKTLCKDCLEKERNLPVYSFGKQKEHEAVMSGNYDFPGVLNDLIFNTNNEANVLARIKFGDTAKGLFTAWDDLINNFGFNPKHMANLIKENGLNYNTEAKSWISYMGKTDRVDGRNQAAHDEAQKMNFDEPMTELVKLMAKNHPTIQQTYTACMLNIFTDIELPFI